MVKLAVSSEDSCRAKIDFLGKSDHHNQPYTEKFQGFLSKVSGQLICSSWKQMYFEPHRKTMHILRYVPRTI